MLKTSFFLRGAEDAEPFKKLSIYCRLELEGFERDVPFSTNLKVPKEYWNDGYVSTDYHLHKAIVHGLQEIETAFAEIFILIKHLHDEDEWTYELIRSYYKPKEEKIKIKKKPKLSAVIEELMTYRLEVEGIKLSTWKTYRTRKKNIFSWLQQTNQTGLRINEIRHRHFDSLKVWLLKLLNPDGTPLLSIDHINKHLTLIKAALDYAVNREYIKYTTVGRLNLKYSKVKPPKYLEPELRQLIFDCDIPAFQKVKDISIFLAYTGFSYTDYLSLKSHHLEEKEQGACFRKLRDKSEVYCLPPLLPEAKAIIDKYGSIEDLPRPDLSDLNKDLKYFGGVCGITNETVGFELTTSVFRETFSSMMENEFFLSTRVIMYMMGHTSPKQLNNYSSVKPARIFHEISQMQIMRGKVFEILIDQLRKAS